MDVVKISEYRGEYFKILQGTERSQSGVMTLGVGKDTGEGDVHPGDQIIYVVEGKAFLRLGKEEFVGEAGSLVTIPAGTHHYVRNEGNVPLFILTIYAPPVY